MDDDLPLEELGGLSRPLPPRSWRERATDLADATGTTPVRLVVGAAFVAVAVVVGLWLTRPPAPPPEVSIPFASSVGATGVPTTSTSAVPVDLVVHVAGAVARPGVLHLGPGARVVDAIDAAGGLTPDADGARINLAAPVADGSRVYVPAVGEIVPAVPGGGPAGGAGDDTNGPLDLNSADEVALDALPGIGPATASAIVAHRAEVGRFTSVDQLLDVRGIGEAKLEQLRPLVTV
jgi:competence protein ComEA